MAAPSLQDQLKALMLQTRAPTANASEDLNLDAQTKVADPSDFTASPTTAPQPKIADVSDDPVTTPPSQPGTDLLAGISPLSYQSAGMGASPGLKGLQDQLRAKLIESQDAQKGTIDLDKQALMNQYARKQDVDWSGANQIIQAAGGNKTLNADYKAPVDQSVQDQTLRAALSKDQGKLTDDQTNQLKAELNNRLLSQGMAAQRQGIQQQRLNESVYGKAVQTLYNDKQLNELTKNNNNITRTTDVLLAPGQQISSSSLHELQQTVTGALSSLASGGGIGERENRYIETVENDYQKLKQKFGDLDSIPRDDPTLVHFLSVAQEGQKYIQSQADQRIKSLTVGHSNITSLPTYAPMFDKVVDEIRGNLQKPKTFGGADTASAGGYDGSSPAPANASPQMKAARLKFLQAKAGQ